MIPETPKEDIDDYFYTVCKGNHGSMVKMEKVYNFSYYFKV